MKRISIGTWAFGAYSEAPLDFPVVLDRLAELGFDGIELGAFPPHPDPATCATTTTPPIWRRWTATSTSARRSAPVA